MAAPSLGAAWKFSTKAIGIVGGISLVGFAYANGLGGAAAQVGANLGSAGGMVVDGINMVPGVSVG